MMLKCGIRTKKIAHKAQLSVSLMFVPQYKCGIYLKNIFVLYHKKGIGQVMLSLSQKI